MQVLKFGGSSVADATRMSRVIDIVLAAVAKDRVILVSSAISGCTDALIAIGEETDPERKAQQIEALRSRHHAIVRRLFTGAERREMLTELDGLFDELALAEPGTCVTFGELFSTRILARKFACEDIATQWLDSRELVRTIGGVVVEGLTYGKIQAAVQAAPGTQLFVAPGFIASDGDGRPTTLGRGGSDYSAALFAAGARASTLEIWTDVPGMMTANPKVIPVAVTIPDISYKAALALAENGAKVLYAPTVKPAMEAGIAFSIRNTFDPRHPGTLVSGRPAVREGEWMGVTSRTLADKGESVVCLVGEGIPSRASAAGRIRAALAEAGIQPLGEVTGEGDLFFIRVRPTVEQAAVGAIHHEFFESRAVTVIPVFIAGFGAVGQELVRLIGLSAGRIAARRGRSIRIVGLSNSRRYVVDLRGIRPEEAAQRLEAGESTGEGAFFDAVLASAPRGSVFVDCTNDHHLYRHYPELFRGGISIVTSNRRSLALPFVEYAALKTEARQNGAFFRYDTTVGNSLPILESIASDANCSDGIESIEAVVSCTLNYIITNYDGARRDSFATLLRQAQDEGLTESDPRTDLGGKDVLRKLLILAREAGVPLEAGDVEIVPMLGPEFFDCPLEEFYQRLACYEPQFIAREAELDAAGQRQRFVASLRRDPAARHGYRAEIKMQRVGPDNPFYWISGTENVTVVRSEYSAPLVIKGAGEGVRLAATGIIKDILM
ncbi:MAG: aspartate kinase [Bacteroidales bacterium]|nr:aspartate kinase [Bacteroidales bacterium]